MITKYFYIAILALICFVGCNNRSEISESEDIEFTLSSAYKELTFGYNDANPQSITFAAQSTWRAKVVYDLAYDNWINLSIREGEAGGYRIQITVDPNENDTRKATLYIESAGKIVSSSITQYCNKSNISYKPL